MLGGTRRGREASEQHPPLMVINESHVSGETSRPSVILTASTHTRPPTQHTPTEEKYERDTQVVFTRASLRSADSEDQWRSFQIKGCHRNSNTKEDRETSVPENPAAASVRFESLLVCFESC